MKSVNKNEILDGLKDGSVAISYTEHNSLN